MSSTHTSNTPLLPHLHLLCMDSQAAVAWEAAIAQYQLTSSSHLKYTIHDSALSQLSPSLQFDAVVSPANSYAILDGGFDDAISRGFSPKDDYAALTRHAQAHLYTTHRGYLPPGQCQIVHLPGEWREERKLRYHDGKGWSCRYLILCPTMRIPRPCEKEVVYECVWSLLNSLERHNDSVADGKGGDAGEETGRGARIESLLMTPLGTGAGRSK
ncbi:putative ADP-ribose 1''-phosphate phosphatase [Seiridium cardinale]